MNFPGSGRKHPGNSFYEDIHTQEMAFELYFVRHGLAGANPIEGLDDLGKARMKYIGTTLRKAYKNEKIALILSGSDWPLVESAKIIKAKLGRDVLSEYIDPMQLFDSPPLMTNMFFERLRSIAEATGILRFVIVTHEPVIKYLCRVDTVFEGSVTRLNVRSKNRQALPEVTYYDPTFIRLH